MATSLRNPYLPPTPKAIVTYYLPRLIAGEAMHPAVRPFIHRYADVYRCTPSDLAARFRPSPVDELRFFFCSVEVRRRRRMPGEGRDATLSYHARGRGAGGGRWSLESVYKIVDREAGGVIGGVSELRYRCRYGAPTDWLIAEYHVYGQGRRVVGSREPVFCVMYVSSHAAAGCEALLESAAFFAPPPPEPAVVMVRNKKRAAPPVAGPPPRPKRIRNAPTRRTPRRRSHRRRAAAAESERHCRGIPAPDHYLLLVATVAPSGVMCSSRPEIRD
jgi:hypothetical protein